MLTQKKTILLLICAILALPAIPICFNALNSLISSKSTTKEIKPKITQRTTSTTTLYDTSDPYITTKQTLERLLTGPIITDIDEVIGSKKSPVIITYFGDYDCSYCINQLQKIKTIINNNYKNKVALVWKDYPIKAGKDSRGYKLAIATRCAGEQNKFWEFQDTIAKHQDNNIKSLVQNTNLDQEKFNTCFNNPTQVKKIITDNKKEGNALNITGVPFIYINKQEFMGEISNSELKRVIEIELN